MERPRRSPWEGLAPGSPASAGGRSRAPSGDRGPWRSERSATRAARPPAADGRRPAVSCREGRDGSCDTCELCHMACGILVLWPRIEPWSSAVKGWSPHYWTATKYHH